jgi:hypothetical protein
MGYMGYLVIDCLAVGLFQVLGRSRARPDTVGKGILDIAALGLKEHDDQQQSPAEPG